MQGLAQGGQGQWLRQHYGLGDRGQSPGARGLTIMSCSGAAAGRDVHTDSHFPWVSGRHRAEQTESGELSEKCWASHETSHMDRVLIHVNAHLP